MNKYNIEFEMNETKNSFICLGYEAAYDMFLATEEWLDRVGYYYQLRLVDAVTREILVESEA